MEFQNGGYVAVDVPFVVPFGHDLAVWFLNSDENGCTGWDSNYGNNFHFPIQSPPNPIIHFHADWSITVDGTLRAGQPFIIDYDLHRLPDCRQDYNGLPTWDVTAHARFDDGSTVDAPLTQLEGQYNRVAAPATVNAPAGAHAVELWFENSDRTGCQRWDSSYGQNFKYDLN